VRVPLYYSNLLNFYEIHLVTANTLSAFSGVMGPVVVSFLVTTWPGVLGWRIAFILTFYMCIVFTTVWYYYIKAEIVPALNTPAAESR